VNFVAPEGTTLAATDRIMRQVEEEVKRLPHVTSVMSSLGEGEGTNVNDATLYVRLTRHLQAQARAGADHRHGPPRPRQVLGPAPERGAGLHFGSSKVKDTPFQYYITGPDLGLLREYSAKVVEGAQGHPGHRGRGHHPGLRQARGQGAHRPRPAPRTWA